MDVNVLRSMVLKFARKKADEAPPPVMKIGINPNLLFRSDTFGLIDMQAPLSKLFSVGHSVLHRMCLKYSKLSRKKTKLSTAHICTSSVVRRCISFSLQALKLVYIRVFHASSVV